MKGRLTWICHGATQSNRDGAFPADESLEERAVEQTRGLIGKLARHDRAWVSPALRTRQTADILGLAGKSEPMLAECDYGRWAGRGLVELQASAPQDLLAWMNDADAVPHGGESRSQLAMRVADWMREHREDAGHTVVITHASVIRMAMLHVLGSPADAFWKIDVEPLSITEMSSDGRRWTLRLVGNHRRD